MFELVLKLFTEILSGISTIIDIKDRLHKSNLDRKSIAKQLVELHSSLDKILIALAGVRTELEAYRGYLISGEGNIDTILIGLRTHLLFYKKELEQIHIILFDTGRAGWSRFEIGHACYCGYEPRDVLKLISLYSPMNYQKVIDLLEGEGGALAEVVMSYLSMLASAKQNLNQKTVIRIVSSFKLTRWGYSDVAKKFVDFAPSRILLMSNIALKKQKECYRV